MIGSDWTRVRDLFERALDQPESEVKAWLDREAGTDAAVRAEVISLLEHHGQAGAFLGEPAAVDAEAFDDPALEPGRVIGPYTIVREAGRGGMGRVYVATDARLGRTVALKAVRAHLTDPAQRDRLRREARAAAVLTHPGICTVYALEELEGDLFIASEFIEGRTLRQEMADDSPSAAAALQTAREIAAALAAAHAAGITHGDLKPENVMRAYDGRLKILDFGLARVEPASPDPHAVRDTRVGAIAGTPGYMAPEQLNGRPRDTRADVFAFGVLIYEYACGIHPFDASTPLGIAARVLESDQRPITAVRPDLPPPLASVIERCLRKAAGDRFASAAGIVQALSIEEKQEIPGARVATWWRAHQLIVVGLYAAASIAAWRIKELHAGRTTAVFLMVGIAATVAAVFRGHLLFTERVNGAGLTAERRRAAPVTLAVDLLIAAGLALDGAIMAPGSPLPALLTLALGVGLALARLVVEPSTTAAAFDTGT